MSKYRFNLELSDKAKEQLDELQRRTDAATLTEVIRRALSVYDALQRHTSDNWELVLRKKGIEKPVLLA
jgi:hypothetical protein